MRRLMFLAITALAFVVPGSVLAADEAKPAGFVEQLEAAKSDLLMAEFSVHVYSGGEFPQTLDEKIDAVPAAKQSTLAKGRAAYREFIVGKSEAQAAAAKAVYVAWLTMLDSMNGLKDSPNNVEQTPAGIAYRQAVNSYKVDFD